MEVMITDSPSHSKWIPKIQSCKMQQSHHRVNEHENVSWFALSHEQKQEMHTAHRHWRKAQGSPACFLPSPPHFPLNPNHTRFRAGAGPRLAAQYHPPVDKGDESAQETLGVRLACWVNASCCHSTYHMERTSFFLSLPRSVRRMQVGTMFVCITNPCYTARAQ